MLVDWMLAFVYSAFFPLAGGAAVLMMMLTPLLLDLEEKMHKGVIASVVRSHASGVRATVKDIRVPHWSVFDEVQTSLAAEVKGTGKEIYCNPYEKKMLARKYDRLHKKAVKKKHKLQQAEKETQQQLVASVRTQTQVMRHNYKHYTVEK